MSKKEKQKKAKKLVKKTKSAKKPAKKPVAKKKIPAKKTAKKKTVKKGADKKKSRKHLAVQKKAIKKPVTKKSLDSRKIKNKRNSKSINKKNVKNQTSSSKTFTEKQQLSKVNKSVSIKSETKKKVGGTASGSRSTGAGLNYREKELEKLLKEEQEEQRILKNMKGRAYCVVDDCDYPALVEDHCRIHFFGLFKEIKRKKQILEKDLITKAFEALFYKYSDDVFHHLFKDLSSDKSFNLAVKKIMNGESGDFELDDAFLD